MAALKKREVHLLENKIFVACIYLDPCYKLLLSEREKISARKHLLSTWDTLQFQKSCNEVGPTDDLVVDQISNAHSSNTDDELEAMLKARESETVIEPEVRYGVFFFLYSSYPKLILMF